MIHPVSIIEAARLSGAKSTHFAKEMQEIRHISIDSRKITDPEHCLFIAIKTSHRDGHDYIQNALKSGVRMFMVSNSGPLQASDASWIKVDDPIVALQEWATNHRKQFSYPVIGIAGSNGKTVVKEWLSSVLADKFRILKSPRSYNSQIGVALSLLGMGNEHSIAIIEAGISLPREMEKLRRMVLPDFGIMTHFGDAHSEGFKNDQEKLDEKLRLFSDCKKVWASSDHPSVINALLKKNIPIRTIGSSGKPDFSLSSIHSHKKGKQIEISTPENELFQFSLPFSDDASIENLLLVILTALELGMITTEIQSNIDQLRPVTMRLELLSENPEVTIINDAYNADLSSVYSAFAVLENNQTHSRKVLVLSDIEHQGKDSKRIHKEVLEIAIQKFGANNILIVGEGLGSLVADKKDPKCYKSTKELLSQFDYSLFRDSTVLLKGARSFELEQLIPFLTRRVNATRFVINLDHLSDNLQVFRKKLKDETHIMAMVKASSYGSGSWEVASALVQEGVGHLAVANLTEAIDLRTNGIGVPIMVLNPDRGALGQLFHFKLEPEIYSFQALEDYYKAGKSANMSLMPLHIKVDTGMHRLGFSPDQAPELIRYLEERPEIKVISVMSHLSAADDPEMDVYSRKQFDLFQDFVKTFSDGYSYPFYSHLLNTAGILRFPEYEMDMVRLGLGLYGVSPLNKKVEGLVEIGSLRSEISQIRSYEKGESIGYNRAQFTERRSRIATIPVGYADGIRRSLGLGKISFLVNGKFAPTFGNICMDLLMIDVTDIPDAAVGDEVVLMGEQNGKEISVAMLAEAMNTIPYEVLAGISQRVRRVFVRE